MDLGGKYAGGWTFIYNKSEYTLMTISIAIIALIHCSPPGQINKAD